MENTTGNFFTGLDGDYAEMVALPNMTGTPERRLLLAILERAILDFVGNEPREVEQAEEWLFGDLDSDTNEKFSFPWVCEQLDLDMYKVATKIRSMPRRGSRKVAPWYFARQQMAA